MQEVSPRPGTLASPLRRPPGCHRLYRHLRDLMRLLWRPLRDHGYLNSPAADMRKFPSLSEIVVGSRLVLVSAELLMTFRIFLATSATDPSVCRGCVYVCVSVPAQVGL